MDEGRTEWVASLPRKLVEKMIRDFEEKGEGKIEHETKVKKTVANRWGSYGHYDNENTEYDYKVRVEMIKGEPREGMMIWFQDSMDIYF